MLQLGERPRRRLRTMSAYSSIPRVVCAMDDGAFLASDSGDSAKRVACTGDALIVNTTRYRGTDRFLLFPVLYTARYTRSVNRKYAEAAAHY